MHIPINGTQSVYTLRCESTVHVLGNVYLSEEFCDDFSPQTQTNVNYPYNMLILRHFFSNHTLLEDINAALELDYVLKANLPPLAIERTEYDEILASESESRLDFETAINATENQAKIYDSLTTVVWQKMLAMATANTEFNLLSGFDWSIVICMIITILNTFAITILCLRLKAISMLVVGVRGAGAEFIFSLPPTTTVKTINVSAEMIWQGIKDALSDLIGLETIMAIILILLFVGLILKIFRTKEAIAKYQTKIFINFESSTFNVCKHLTDLNYASDFYKIEIKPTILSLEQSIFFGYIKLNNCIKITNKLTKLIIPIPDKIYIYPHELRRTARLLANEFHPLMILTNQKNKHIDVIHLADVLSGTDMNGGELCPISALVHMGNA